MKALRQFWQIHKPLGWAQLSHQKVRLAVALTGVAFSNILIFTQLGLRAMLFDGITLLPEALKGELYLLSARVPSIDFGFGGLPKSYLYQADTVPGVESVRPLYIGRVRWTNPETLRQPKSPDAQPVPIDIFAANFIKVLAFNPVQPVLNLPEVDQQVDRLTTPGTVLFDRLGQPTLGNVPQLFAEAGSVNTTINNRRVQVVGLFSLGSNFNDKGYVLMSDWNYEQISRQGSNSINVGVVILEPGADIGAVQAQLQARLPPEVRVATKAELIALEQEFAASFPQGKVLSFGAIMGFVVGMVIVYQILYTDISNHLPEYATLKAMGYSDRSLWIIVLQEALILAVLGFIPGCLASYGVYGLLAQATRIPVVMRWDVAVQVFVLTVVMCSVAGTMAMNKLRSADPVDVF
ncbi:ABC transporter permease DevC [Leptolyngbya sp. FACHB-711]|uniref:ABC transporter permease DevC n=1 Tax=unclassified Leptolyngbya TaxID=2650499 RepID=UPI001683CD21|nr:ABC transporter permease DevC [Leptolyngbya sp. FACHB-711]MBD1852647.1 FtsX-like permease family protein [Cyanobacteria bacterium FACHB-502]MBD2027928.1 FtsX-like permease family protein [Leptolyngbya sp. FACHB-711]